MLSQNVDFDAFSASIEGNEDDFIYHLLQRIDLSSETKIRPRWGYHYGVQIHRGEKKYCDVLWGSDHGGIHVQAQGDTSSLIRSLTLEHIQTHRLHCSPSRIDAKIDWEEPELFDRISELLTAFAMERDLIISHQGDWARGQSRTLYVGSRKSQLMVRLYEKGWKMGGNPDWIRLETEVKPKKADQREALLTYSAPQVLNTGWAGEFISSLGFIEAIPTRLPSAYQPSDELRARAALVKQWYRIADRWQSELGGWENFGDEMEKQYKQLTDPCYEG